MEIRAYDELYVEAAQNNLGNMFDYALVTMGIDIDKFESILIVSDVSKQFEAGNPAYVCGRNGCELAKMILDQSGISYEPTDDVMYVDKSTEYWTGWILAYYQWYSGDTFREILAVNGVKDILGMYPLYHEMDIMKFVEYMDKKKKEKYPATKLRVFRDNSNLSQTELARISGVSIRQIQLFEQKKRDINKTQVSTLLRLSRALSCNMEDLVE